ncbi:MAG: hypothetical protein JWO81_2148 [Alphaproteobacteria bacterium]|nr:hypothetical protein [Alphaproteobacteria bacterium]
MPGASTSPSSLDRRFVMTEDCANFWDPAWVIRSWRGLDGTLSDLIGAYGRDEVTAALKRVKRAGAPPRPDDLELRVFVGRHAASYLDGSESRKSDTKIKALWAAQFPEDEPETRRAQAYRVLRERQVLGLAFAINERWENMSEARKRLALAEAASLPMLHAAVKDLARSLAEGDARELEEAPPSQGLVADAPGLPRLKRGVKIIAEELTTLAFRHGHLRRNTPPVL